mmetsp:Transcript_92335/g.258054  ORF Transcript_92335/g.258054 Transcript_92335/m.258054 type:complete len:164 (-) Transcript_92335:230-721(-)
MRSINTVAIFAAIFSSADAFQSIARQQPTRNLPRTSSRLFGSKEEEIAKLEEQLKRLKKEKETVEVPVSAPTATDDAGELEGTPIGMFLTEQWKEQEANADSESSGGGIMNVLIAVGFALVVVLFSQIPIGQEDLSKYSVGSSPTAEQIDLGDLNRARRSGDL